MDLLASLQTHLLSWRRATKKGQFFFAPFLVLGVVPCVAIPAYAAVNIPITVNLSEAVNVTGIPRIAVDVGGTPRYATYTSGTGTNTLTFTLSPQAGDVDLDGVTVSSPIDLNGGTMSDTKGNALSSLAFTPPTTTNVKVNYPSLGMDFIYDADGRYTLNGTVYNDLASFLSAAGGTFTRASIGTYYDSTGTLQTAASGVPRFNYDPVTHAAKGILIEEARINTVYNNTLQGAVSGVIGSGGVMPTGWSFTGAGITGLTRTISLGTENGINYIDIRLNGTSPGGLINVVFSSSLTSTISGQTWAQSVYMCLAGGSTTNTSSWKLWLDGANASNIYTETKGASITAPTTCSSISQSRYTGTGTFTNVNTAKTASLYVDFNAAAAPIDITLRFALPQNELGAFSTSPIPTSGVTVTRAADVLKIPTGSWYNASQGTMFVHVYDARPTGNGIWASLGTTSITDRCQMYSNGATMQMQNYSGGVAQVLGAGGSRVYGVNKAAYALQDANFAYVSNGGTLGTKSTGTLGTKTLLVLGRGADYTNDMINDHVLKFKYYPSRVINTQLQLLTQ